ncbi:uncharacterized protein LOC128236545 [Mya arenaria]|uniref:uncharacterized protein LOC128236545 n=1 Tax=Mya arenaria TaxID=6604 RepID=UPI0022E27581|nr:uncharacterized protein LOC128236545 [Mya arenaria]
MDKAFGIILLLGFAGVVNTQLPGLLKLTDKICKMLQDFVKTASRAGVIPFGEDGRTISWSFKGMMVGFHWKYMGICTDSKTGHTETVFMESRGGAMDHCLTNLIGRLNREEL